MLVQVAMVIVVTLVLYYLVALIQDRWDGVPGRRSNTVKKVQASRPTSSPSVGYPTQVRGVLRELVPIPIFLVPAVLIFYGSGLASSNSRLISAAPSQNEKSQLMAESVALLARAKQHAHEPQASVLGPLAPESRFAQFLKNGADRLELFNSSQSDPVPLPLAMSYSVVDCHAVKWPGVSNTRNQLYYHIRSINPAASAAEPFVIHIGGAANVADPKDTGFRWYFKPTADAAWQAMGDDTWNSVAEHRLSMTGFNISLNLPSQVTAREAWLRVEYTWPSQQSSHMLAVFDPRWYTSVEKLAIQMAFAEPLEFWLAPRFETGALQLFATPDPPYGILVMGPGKAAEQVAGGWPGDKRGREYYVYSIEAEHPQAPVAFIYQQRSAVPLGEQARLF